MYYSPFRERRAWALKSNKDKGNHFGKKETKSNTVSLFTLNHTSYFVLQDVFVGGTDTTSVLMELAMTELLNHPCV